MSLFRSIALGISVGIVLSMLSDIFHVSFWLLFGCYLLGLLIGAATEHFRISPK